MNDDFELVHRPHGDCWRLKGRNVWIVYYWALKAEDEPAYIVYASIDYCPEGRDPWTVNNKRVAARYSLQDAMTAAVSY